MTSKWRSAVYWGLLPIMILIGAAVGEGWLGPPSIPPKWSQSAPGQDSTLASMCIESSPAIRVLHGFWISEPLPGLKVMNMPGAAPAPVQVQDSTDQCACVSNAFMASPRLVGSSPSPKIYTAAFVPENPESSLTSRGTSDAGIDLGALNRSKANWASAACARACAVSFSKDAIFSADPLRSASQYASFTPVIHTMVTVETTPTTKLPIKNRFAISAIRLAVANDGHIRLPLWFPLGAIIISR